MKFVLQGEYCTLNEYSDAERTHYRKGAGIKKAETERALIDLQTHKYMWGIAPPLEQKIFKFTWYRVNRRSDPDNIAFAKKFIMDAFVESGLIKNDGWKSVKGFIDIFEVDRANPRVEIELI